MAKRKPQDDIDRIGMAVLELMNDGAQFVCVTRKKDGASFRYKVAAIVKRKVKKPSL